MKVGIIFLLITLAGASLATEQGFVCESDNTQITVSVPYTSEEHAVNAQFAVKLKQNSHQAFLLSSVTRVKKSETSYIIGGRAGRLVMNFAAAPDSRKGKLVIAQVSFTPSDFIYVQGFDQKKFKCF